jgi:hypothetical protein
LANRPRNVSNLHFDRNLQWLQSAVVNSLKERPSDPSLGTHLLQSANQLWLSANKRKSTSIPTCLSGDKLLAWGNNQQNNRSKHRDFAVPFRCQAPSGFLALIHPTPNTAHTEAI